MNGGDVMWGGSSDLRGLGLGGRSYEEGFISAGGCLAESGEIPSRP